MIKVFIDGSAGTTGLRINERLGGRRDVEIIKIPEELRKDTAVRAEAMNSSDVVFLCLPDEAAIEAAALVTNPQTVVIDTSTAHRVSDDWTYGFAEIGGLKEKIKNSKRIANPGCHASGFIALVAPLTQAGIIKADTHLSAFSLTGYSGGGKKMIADYESERAGKEYLNSPRMYGLTQMHKHLPEMVKMCGLTNAPAFAPIVADYYAGMEVVITLDRSQTRAARADIEKVYADYYDKGLVRFVREASEGGFLSAGAYAGRDDMEVSVQGNDERILLTARFDNLGKGASGAAIQNMNIVMGIDERTGLNVL